MIIPISKIEKPKKANQCNPINMLSTFEKVLKLVIKRQLDKYLENSDIITEHQLDFKKGYSCEITIQTIIDEWKLIVSKKKILGVIFMDLK